MCLGEPLQIVSLNGKSGFKFEKEVAYAILCSPELANRKVVPVSVAGEFRQGKSFLLNCLIHLLERNQKDALVKNYLFFFTCFDRLNVCCVNVGQ